MKQSIIFVPFEAVPQFLPFRFKKQWWRRKVGTLNGAVSFSGSAEALDENVVVAMPKKRLRKTEHWKILDEFSSTIVWPRLK